MRKFTIVTIILDILVAICFFVFYGPFESFRNNIISTALSTKTHGLRLEKNIIYLLPIQT